MYEAVKTQEVHKGMKAHDVNARKLNLETHQQIHSKSADLPRASSVLDSGFLASRHTACIHVSSR